MMVSCKLEEGVRGVVAIHHLLVGGESASHPSETYRHLQAWCFRNNVPMDTRASLVSSWSIFNFVVRYLGKNFQ